METAPALLALSIDSNDGSPTPMPVSVNNSGNCLASVALGHETQAPRRNPFGSTKNTNAQPRKGDVHADTWQGISFGGGASSSPRLAAAEVSIEHVAGANESSTDAPPLPAAAEDASAAEPAEAVAVPAKTTKPVKCVPMEDPTRLSTKFIEKRLPVFYAALGRLTPGSPAHAKMAQQVSALDRELQQRRVHEARQQAKPAVVRMAVPVE